MFNFLSTFFFYCFFFFVFFFFVLQKLAALQKGLNLFPFAVFANVMYIRKTVNGNKIKKKKKKKKKDMHCLPFSI